MNSPEIDEMARLLAQSWALRSPDEQSGFVTRLMTDPSPPTADIVRKVRERGALSGAVAPRDLVRGISRTDADQLLDNVLVDFDRTLVDGSWSWTLRNGPREEALSRLAATGTLQQALDDASAINTDAAGEVLRELARTGERAQNVTPRVALQALAWAEPLGGHAGDLAEARRQASLAAIRDSYETLLRRGFHGRTRELARLKKFAEAPVRPGHPVPFLTVTGIGGSGKSTLLAALVLPYLERLAAGDPSAPAIVVIDFDRVHFRVNAELELSFELTRQLGCAAPVASADFSVLRHQTREERKQTGVDVAQGHHNVEGIVRSSSGFEYEANVLVRLHELTDRPVVLVLDTFEEWQRDRPYEYASRDTWNDPEQRIMEWIWRLRNEMGLHGLRVIASGRAEVLHMEGVHAAHPVRVGDLDRASAIKLLGSAGVNEPDAGTLVRTIGGNPLTLRVAARFYRRLSKAERKRFAAEPHRGSARLDHELRRAVLYDRFLDHIRDRRVRALAHPGLALRRVTPSLVRHILAVYCGLGVIGDAEARTLTEKLADEVWLVRATPDGLRHQPDVRRAMLRMMSEDPEQAETVRRIHRAAAAWYREGRDPDLSREAAEVEWFYHRLMLETGDRSIMRLLYEASSAPLAVVLGGAVADLEPRVGNQVRALRGDTLTEVEARGLPDKIWKRWIERHGDRLVSTGESRRALRFVTDRLRVSQTIPEPSWLTHAYCDAARWSEYWQQVELDRLRPEEGRSEFLRSGRYAFLNALGSEDPRALDHYDSHLDRQISSWQERKDTARGPDSERLFLGLLRRSGAHLHGLSPVQLALTEDHYPVDQLRNLLVWMALSSSHGPLVLVQTAGLFRPDPDWIDAWDRATHTERLGFSDELTAGELRSDEVLGEWSSRFGRYQPAVTLAPEEPSDLVRVLRGDNPELRPAIHLAVEAVARRHGMAELAEIATGLLPVPVTDLRPDSVRHAKVSEKLVFQLVEYVDRSGVMRAFLDAAQDRYPEIEVVGRVANVFSAWDDACHRLLERVVTG